MNVNDFYEKLADLMEEYDAEFDITQYNGLTLTQDMVE